MTDIVFCGVGGQGIVSIGHLLGQVSLTHDSNFISSETHGMSQRGGSVIFHFRLGNKRSPLIPKGKADIIVATEPVEGLRHIEYLKPGGLILVNDTPIHSPIARQLGIEYPNLEEIYAEMRKWPSEVFIIKTSEVVPKYGLIKAQNILFLGALLGLEHLPLDKDELRDLILVKWPKYEKQNLKAFDIGYQMINHQLKHRYNDELLTN